MSTYLENFEFNSVSYNGFLTPAMSSRAIDAGWKSNQVGVTTEFGKKLYANNQ